MADKDGNPHTGGGELDHRVQNLLGLDRHLPLFLGRAVVQEVVNVRNDVEGDLFAELLWWWCTEDEDALGLVPKLVHAFLARARDGLVGGDHNPLDPNLIV